MMTFFSGFGSGCKGLKPLIGLGISFMLLLSTAQAQNWFLGEWQYITDDGISVTLQNFPNGTYTFTVGSYLEDDDVEVGSWKLNGTTLTQAWTDENGVAQQVDYAIDKRDNSYFLQSGGNLNGQVFSFFKQRSVDALGQAPAVTPLFEPPLEQGTVPPLDLSALGDSAWLVGEWQASDGSSVTVWNYANGSYSFELIDYYGSVYTEVGRWTYGDGKLTQSWDDPATGAPQTATYDIVKLSDVSYRMSGGNLNDTVWVFNQTRPAEALGAPPSLQPDTDTSASPPTRSDPNVTKDWLLGEWLARDEGKSYRLTVQADALNWETRNAKGSVTEVQTGKVWSLNGNTLTETWQPEGEWEHVAGYDLERVSEDSFRMIGGNFNLTSLLFQRVDNAAGISPEVSWLVGDWEGVFGLNQQLYTFSPDGSFSLQQSGYLSDSSGTEHGTWSLQQGALTLMGDSTRTYTFDTLFSDLALNLTGGDLGGDSVYLSKPNRAPYDPLKVFDFGGQYVKGADILTLRFADTRYEGDLKSEGETYAVTGRAFGDTLTLNIAKPEPEPEPETLTLRLDNNGLSNSDVYAFGDTFYRKISETALPLREGLTGQWLETDDSSNTLLLLDDGRYLETHYYSIPGVETRVSKTDGLYRVEGDQLTLDPECAGPSTYPLNLADNQLLLTIESDFLEGGSATASKLAAPESSTAYEVAEYAKREAVLTEINNKWLERIPLATVNPDLPRPAAGAELSLDPNPGDSFPGSTVFAEPELYPYTSDYYYVYDTRGSFRTVNQSDFIYFPNLYKEIDSSKGQYYDKRNEYFFPNGRVMTYVESYYDSVNITYPPTPTKQFLWGRYRIEGDTLIVDGDPEIRYDLLAGRRQLRWDETCYANVKSAAQ